MTGRVADLMPINSRRTAEFGKHAAMRTFERRPLYHYWAPKYWPTWIGLAFLRMSCWLPYRWQIGLGKAIGRLAHRIGAQRRAIARRNIELCFPELSVE